MRRWMICITLVSSACGGPPKVPPPPTVKIPVAVPCVASGGKPEPIEPLSASFPEDVWAAMPPGSKAQAVKGQAGRRMNYADELLASVAGCK